MKTKALSLVLSLMAGFSAMAASEEIQNLSAEDSQMDVSQVQNAFILKRPGSKSATRISLIVKDSGGSTDVSPGLSLYLIFWQDGEMANASAAFDLGNTFGVQDFKSEAGKLVLVLKDFNDQFKPVNKVVTVDYADFAAKFENAAAKPDSDFGDIVVPGSITLKTAN